MRRIGFFYLASFGMSLLGNSVTAIALPLLVLFTTGSPLGVGVVAIAAALPSAIAGLVMGSLVDRFNRRTMSILSDVISAAALLVLPVVALTGELSLGWFIAVAILNSFGDVPGITARETMLPAIARASKIDASRLIGLRESITGIALLIGPAIAGLLVAALEPAAVFWITSGLAALAALLTLFVPSRAARRLLDEETAKKPERAASLFAGIIIIFRSPLLRALVLLGVGLAAVLAATQGMVIPVYFTMLDQPQNVGFVLSALAAGLLIGGVLYAILGDRISRRAWLFLGLGVVTGGFWIIAILGPVWSTLVGVALVGAGAGSLNAVIGVTFIENVADSQRGRVLGAQNSILTLVPALGIGLAAVLIEFASLSVTTAILAGVWMLITAAALLTPRLRNIKRLET